MPDRAARRPGPILRYPMRSILARLVGGGNEAHLSKLRPVVAKINGLEEHCKALTDEQIREEMAQVRAEVAENA